MGEKETMPRWPLLILITLLGGCSHMTTQTKWLQAGHGLLMAADSSQTIQGQNAPDCYREAGWPTRDIIGEHPSESAIVGFQALRFVLHSSVSNWLDKKVSNDDDEGWRWIRAGWHVLSFAYEIDVVRRNHNEGLRVFSPHAVPQRCIDARNALKP